MIGFFLSPCAAACGKDFLFLLLWMQLWIVGLGWDYSGLYGERTECSSSYRVPVSVSTVQLGLLFVCKWDLISCKAIMPFIYLFIYLVGCNHTEKSCMVPKLKLKKNAELHVSPRFIHAVFILNNVILKNIESVLVYLFYTRPLRQKLGCHIKNNLKK